MLIAVWGQRIRKGEKENLSDLSPIPDMARSLLAISIFSNAHRVEYSNITELMAVIVVLTSVISLLYPSNNDYKNNFDYTTLTPMKLPLRVHQRRFIR